MRFLLAPRHHQISYVPLSRNYRAQRGVVDRITFSAFRLPISLPQRVGHAAASRRYFFDDTAPFIDTPKASLMAHGNSTTAASFCSRNNAASRVKSPTPSASVDYRLPQPADTMPPSARAACHSSPIFKTGRCLCRLASPMMPRQPRFRHEKFRHAAGRSRMTSDERREAFDDALVSRRAGGLNATAGITSDDMSKLTGRRFQEYYWRAHTISNSAMGRPSEESQNECRHAGTMPSAAVPRERLHGIGARGFYFSRAICSSMIIEARADARLSAWRGAARARALTADAARRHAVDLRQPHRPAMQVIRHDAMPTATPRYFTAPRAADITGDTPPQTTPRHSRTTAEHPRSFIQSNTRLPAGRAPATCSRADIVGIE